MLVIFQVIWLSSQMSSGGVMEDLLSSVRSLVTRRTAMAVLPAVIGLLPMPGGALFSAPLVDSCDAEGRIASGLKAQTNHWFRHIWEYWWPLYPGVLLAMTLTRLEVWQFMIVGVPLSLAAVLAGYVFLLRRIDSEAAQGADEAVHVRVRRLLTLLLPIIVVIGCYGAVRLLHVGLTHVWAHTPLINRYVPMCIGLFGAMAVLQLQRPLPLRGWRGLLLSGRALNMVVIVSMVLVYGAFIEAKLPDGRSLIGQMHAEMEQWGIPVVAVIMLLPLVSGLATGLSVGFVGASFPIVISLLGDAPPVRTLMATTALAYGFGYVGQLLSPVHVCLVVTSQHFHTSVLRNAAALLKPTLFILGAALLMHLVLR
jgi:hypothetical protein